MQLFFIFITGAVFGSFINFVSSRLVSGQSLWVQRSECDSCHKPLAWHDLIPMLNFVWLKGRCRYCQAKLPQYLPLVELFSAVAFCFLFSKFGFGLVFFLWVLFLLLFLLNALTDYLTYNIYNVPLYALLLVSVGIALTQASFLWQLAQSVLFTLIIFIVAKILGYFLKKETMGSGDYYILFALGIIFELQSLVWLLFIASLSGIGAYFLVKKKQMPFVPLLFLATIILVLIK